MTITVRRTGALGDVLCVTPVLARLRRDHPAVKIVVETAYPIAVAHGPWMDAQRSANGKSMNEDIYYSLDLVYEASPKIHVVDAYLWHIFGEEMEPETKSLVFEGAGTWRKAEDICVIHAARSWSSRTFSNAFWDAVAAQVRTLGLKPVFVGGAGDYGGPLWATNSLTKLHLRQVASLIDGAAVFIGSDSSLIHLAGTTDTPIVGLYTSVRAKYRMPYRHGELGWHMVGLEPPIDCRGCLETKPAPVTNMTCDRGDNICTRSIPPTEVLAAVRELTGRGLVKKHPGIVMPNRPSANP